MTVENTNSTISYTGNSSVTTFAYNFLTYSTEHLFIYFDDVLQTSGFTITGIGDDNGGDVTFVSPPITGVTIRIDRTVPDTQLLAYQEYGPFPAKANERGLDLLTMAVQQTSRNSNRGKMDKRSLAAEDNIIVFDDTGNSKDSGKKLSEVGNGGSYIGENPPTLPQQGDRWTRCTDMKGFIYYVDADSAQWVEDRPSYGDDTIGDVSIPYIFDTVADYQASTIVFPVGKTIHLKDRGADFTIITGTGTANTFNIIASTSVNQSIEYIAQAVINMNALGFEVANTGAQNDTIFDIALDLSKQAKTGFFIACKKMTCLPGVYNFDTTKYIKVSMILECDGGGQDGGWPVVFQWPADTFGFVFLNFNTAFNGSTLVIEGTPTTGSDNFILKGVKLQGGGGTLGSASGIEQRIRGTVDNVNIDGFSHHNHAIIANGTADPSTSGNANNWLITGNCRYTNAGNDGLFIDGGDTNAGLSNNLDCSKNGRYGINDSSFLGNTHVGAHVNGNVSGSYISDGDNAFSVFIGCYSESGWPASNIKFPAMVLGGDHGAGFTTNTTAIIDAQGISSGIRNYQGKNTSAIPLSMQIAREDNEILTYKADGDFSSGLQAAYWENTSKTWRVVHARDTGNRTAIAYTTDLTTTTQADGNKLPPGRAWLEDSYMGQVPVRRMQRASLPTSGDFSKGDVVYRRSPVAGGTMGDVCTTSGIAGSTAVFKAFSTIAV